MSASWIKGLHASSVHHDTIHDTFLGSSGSHKAINWLQHGKTCKFLIFLWWNRDTSVVLMKGYISFFQRKSTAPEQEWTELWLTWWTGVINKNYVPSGIIFWQCYLSTHLPLSFLMRGVPCTRSCNRVACFSCHTSDAACRGGEGGGEEEEGHKKGLFSAPEAQMWEGGCSTTNHQSGHSHQNTDQPNPRGYG